MTVVNQAFGERLRTLRRARGMSQAELGGDEYTLSYISHVERGRRRPGPEMVRYLAQRLRVEPEELGFPDGAGEEPTRSNLEPGKVTRMRTMSTAPANGDQAGARLALSLSQASRAESMGNPEFAEEVAREGAALALESGHFEAWWTLSMTRARALIGIGEYEAAADVCAALADDALAQAEARLLAEAHLRASTAFRFAQRQEEASRHGAAALAAASDETVGSALRTEILIALMAAGGSRADAAAEMLEEEFVAIVEPHVSGLAAWALGTQAFAHGDADRGIDWHRFAQDRISAEVSLRDWARFARSSASERVAAGRLDDVDDLLRRAHMGLGALGSADELADLARVEADMCRLQGKPLRAIQVLNDAVTEDLPQLARGRLLQARALARRELGDLDGAREDALASAEALTRGRAVNEAIAAWELHGQLAGMRAKEPN